MRTNFDIQSILNSPAGHLNQHLAEKPVKKRIIKARNDCKEVQKMHWDLKYFCLEQGLLFVPELRFDKNRKYRFDFAVMRGITEEQARKFKYGKENIVAGIEYQGGIFMKTKSGHSNPKGATRDSDKLNLAQSLGWPLLTFTALNFQNVIQDLERIITQNS